jgi:hypothetical protein
VEDSTGANPLVAYGTPLPQQTASCGKVHVLFLNQFAVEFSNQKNAVADFQHSRKAVKAMSTAIIHANIFLFLWLQVSSCATFAPSSYLQTTKEFDFTGLTSGLTIAFWHKYTGNDAYPSILDFGNDIARDNILCVRDNGSDRMACNTYLGTALLTTTIPAGWPSGMLLVITAGWSHDLV